MMEQILFFIFATIAVLSAIGVISVKNAVHSAFYLMITLLQVAAIFILLRSPFLAAIQVFIYVGAVMVLFLFAVMILDIGKEELRETFNQQGVIAIPAVLVMFALIGYLIIGGKVLAPVGGYTNDVLIGNSTEILGKELYTKYLFPFEVVSILLLIALVGAIVLVMKDRGKR